MTHKMFASYEKEEYTVYRLGTTYFNAKNYFSTMT